MARVAAYSSTAMIRVRLSTAVRSLRAADQPIETWSSCIAEDGIESAEAGTASRFISLTSAACVYWAIISPESTPASCGEERRQAVRAVLVEQPVGAALGDGAEVGGGDGEEVQDVGDGRAVEVAVGLHAPVGQHDRVVDGGGQLAVGDQAGVREGVPAGARDLRGAAHGVGVLDARARRPGGGR